MGARLVGTAFAVWSYQLSPRPMLALVRMAHSAKDDDPRPTYWAGWRPLAVALGRDMPADDDHSQEADRLRRNAQRATERAIASLIDAGAISRVAAGRRGAQAEYALNITPIPVGKSWQSES